MFDINQVEKDALAELAKERADKAKGKIKASLQAIARARAVVDNLELEHAVLMRDIGSDVG